MGIPPVVIIMKMRNSSKAPASDMLNTVFLDRDGVINEKMPEGEYVRSVNELRLVPGVAAAVARLNRARLRVLVVSNQRGIALGLYGSRDVDAIHSALQEQLAVFGAHIDAFYICPHDRGACSCRKPLPGMFEQAQRDFDGITAAAGVMIGDSLSDMEFGRRTGMRTILIEGSGSGDASADERARHLADWTCASLPEAVEEILAVLPAPTGHD
jgi:D-glycero-D-manno-heptose 1,7-bisphosphate phosphatase